MELINTTSKYKTIEVLISVKRSINTPTKCPCPCLIDCNAELAKNSKFPCSNTYNERHKKNTTNNDVLMTTPGQRFVNVGNIKSNGK